MAEQRKIVTAMPENSETPLDQVRSWVTPNSLFFVRNHFNPPRIDADRWRLRVEGCVGKAIEWTFDELLTVTFTLFAVIDIVGSVPLLISLKDRLGGIREMRATLVSGGLMLLFVFLGEQLLRIFGVDVGSFAVGGSIVIPHLRRAVDTLDEINAHASADGEADAVLTGGAGEVEA